MNLSAEFEQKTFIFKQPGGTSRGVLTEKKSWLIKVWDKENPDIKGIGECSVIPNLSPDYKNDLSYQSKIKNICENINFYVGNIDELKKFPSIFFGLETALMDLKNGGKRIFFNNSFTQGEQSIPINGLIWMGKYEFMLKQIEEKLNENFSCIKMKIGAIDFEQEIEILKSIRTRFPPNKITLRVDANGAFTPQEAEEKLNRLKVFNIHSIEQPIKQGQIQEMRNLCKKNILDIALDEELIGVYNFNEKYKLLNEIQPKYIILKPSLTGGFKGTKEWIEIANELQIGWWITSALESNIGLDAIAQFTGNYNVNLPQGLGTGSLYTNNIPGKLKVENGYLKRK